VTAVVATTPTTANRFPSRRLGVLVSGRGSNLQALIDAIADGRLDASIAVVISNVAGAGGLDRARHAGIETAVVDHRGWPSRDDFDRALVEELRAREVEVVCLAGFMRKIGPGFIAAFPDAIVNIHPSLLPSFPGLDAQHQALAHGVKFSGCTVHFVDENLDAGPIVRQAVVPVLDDDTAEALSARILAEEHRIYTDAIRLVISGEFRIEGRRVVENYDAGS